MSGLARRLASQCRLEAGWLRGGAVVAMIAALVLLYCKPGAWVITFVVIGGLMEFIAATLRHDAMVLDRLANLYECQEPKELQ